MVTCKTDFWVRARRDTSRVPELGLGLFELFGLLDSRFFWWQVASLDTFLGQARECGSPTNRFLGGCIPIHIYIVVYIWGPIDGMAWNGKETNRCCPEVSQVLLLSFLMAPKGEAFTPWSVGLSRQLYPDRTPSRRILGRCSYTSNQYSADAYGSQRAIGSRGGSLLLGALLWVYDLCISDLGGTWENTRTRALIRATSKAVRSSAKGMT